MKLLTKILTGIHILLHIWLGFGLMYLGFALSGWGLKEFTRILILSGFLTVLFSCLYLFKKKFHFFILISASIFGGIFLLYGIERSSDVSFFS